ncbi:hypothetical protein [Aeromicrobium terrae]|uniref:Uncharacterized protein n=1 Tax=Aeromicrobium terrae TaxID=2498846 RepID=A0A5C8NFL1_9ACTN|nr:hypothetical protein [Aeromicrobium terrae]TXL57703.1 hypothetical protein FHP06_13055 [Aeromicrobium terrae]
MSDDARPGDQAPDDTAGRAERPAPARPTFASGLPQREELQTPRTIGFAHATIFASAIAFLVPTAVALTRIDELRSALRKSISDKADDYSAEDIRHAVDVALAGVGLIALLLLILEIAAVRSLARRQQSARTMLMVLTVIHLPAMIVTSAFRDGGVSDLAWTAAQALFLVLTFTMAAVHPTKRWLQAKPPIAARTLTSYGFGSPSE